MIDLGTVDPKKIVSQQCGVLETFIELGVPHNLKNHDDTVTFNVNTDSSDIFSSAYFVNWDVVWRDTEFWIDMEISRWR